MAAPARNAKIVTRTTTYRHGKSNFKPYNPVSTTTATTKGCCVSCRREVGIGTTGEMFRHRIDRYIHCLAGEEKFINKPW